ncbi:MAG: shikimate kinase AroK [Halieaceae bacterium]|nr:shikimate kinase AroK [Halieaceae bacterium]
MRTPNRIFLVGPMGAGKTTTGQALAKLLKLNFVDSDNEIEARAGASISWIFDVEGEARFRDREARVIDELTQRTGIVLATGGGAVLRQGNRRVLATRGFVVYLYLPVEEQFARTRNDRRRPLLQGDDPLRTLRELMAVRDPLYREVADHVLAVDAKSKRREVGSVAEEIARFVGKDTR